MANKQKHPQIYRLIQILCIGYLVLVSPLSYATYYGEHYYKYRYGHFGHPYYRPYYDNHFGHHYGAQAYFSGDAAYVVLGVAPDASKISTMGIYPNNILCI